MKSLIQQNPVTAILRNVKEELFRDYVFSLYEGGLRSFEVSFSSPAALSQLEWMIKNLPAGCSIGAGTILNIDTAESAINAGANFLLSPSSVPEVMNYCSRNHIRLLPGVFSPTDVSLCLSHGFHTLKLFPACSLPLNYINNLKGPFPAVDFVAVGGVTPANTIDYLRAGYLGVGIGNALTEAALIENRKWEQITANIQNYLKSVKKEIRS